VTFDTLSAAQALRKSGFEDRQAEAIVTTISKAMSETVATKADLELQGSAIRKDLELQGSAIRKDLELQGEATRAEIVATRTDLEKQIAAIRKDMELQASKTSGKIEKLEQSMASLHDKTIIRLGGLMVSMAVLFLAVGPFYIRWVMSIVAS
ncbi:MAG: hypothetical protein OXG54_13020, partial [Gammaproteobacteria bacterium]|nr:hypothetical protein [Gammaproteobacteria bacterium]